MSQDNFEENIKKLEEIVSSLENGNLTLDEAIKTFEEGIKISKMASEKLDNAEKKINILLTNADGSVEEEAFEVEE